MDAKSGGITVYVQHVDNGLHNQYVLSRIDGDRKVTTSVGDRFVGQTLSDVEVDGLIAAGNITVITFWQPLNP